MDIQPSPRRGRRRRCPSAIPSLQCQGRPGTQVRHSAVRSAPRTRRRRRALELTRSSFFNWMPQHNRQGFLLRCPAGPSLGAVAPAEEPGWQQVGMQNQRFAGMGVPFGRRAVCIRAWQNRRARQRRSRRRSGGTGLQSQRDILGPCVLALATGRFDDQARFGHRSWGLRTGRSGSRTGQPIGGCRPAAVRGRGARYGVVFRKKGRRPSNRIRSSRDLGRPIVDLFYVGNRYVVDPSRLDAEFGQQTRFGLRCPVHSDQRQRNQYDDQQDHHDAAGPMLPPAHGRQCGKLLGLGRRPRGMIARCNRSLVSASPNLDVGPTRVDSPRRERSLGALHWADGNTAGSARHPVGRQLMPVRMQEYRCGVRHLRTVHRPGGRALRYLPLGQFHFRQAKKQGHRTSIEIRPPSRMTRMWDLGSSVCNRSGHLSRPLANPPTDSSPPAVRSCLANGGPPAFLPRQLPNPGSSGLSRYLQELPGTTATGSPTISSPAGRSNHRPSGRRSPPRNAIRVLPDILYR